MNIQLLFDKAKEAGFSASEVYRVTVDSIEVGVTDATVKKHQISSSDAICFRGLMNGKMGYASTEKISDESIEQLIINAKDSALLIEKDDQEFIYSGDGQYVDVVAGSSVEFDTQFYIDTTLDVEQAILKTSDKIVKVADTQMKHMQKTTYIANSNGLEVKQYASNAMLFSSPVAKDGDGMVNAYDFAKGVDYTAIDIDKFVKTAVKNTLQKVDAKPMKSGLTKVIFSNKVMASLLGIMSGNFNADVMQEGRSKLEGLEGQKIANELITIVDNPHLENSFSSCGFDDEGVPTYKKNIVDNGTFTGFLHNLKTANKAGVKTTGNAKKAGVTSPIKVGTTNLYLQTGESELEEMILAVGNGVFVTEMDGGHSGANAVTGDFSLPIRGLLIEDGKLTTPVKQVTMAANFFEVLKNVVAVGDDFETTHMGAGSPSVSVGEISIAGE
ncbi:MAG: hypothetical protein ATN35_07555 [Epulopiscium sp. Nele67-Bin004]|nr:MAG: hypothetical protein ATN35_07555 [Epulopiscium sp. Nele67-Bin004]